MNNYQLMIIKDSGLVYAFNLGRGDPNYLLSIECTMILL